MKKKNIAVILSIILFGSCVHVSQCSDGQDARDMMSQSVKIYVSIAGTVLTKGDNGEVTEREEVLNWTGSGVVIAADIFKGSGESLVMSAAHVTEIPPMLISRDRRTVFITQASLTTVQKLDGSSCDAEQIYSDVPNDVGVLRVSCIAGNVARIAKELPPVGSSISVSGAGLGIHPNNVFLVEDGRFLGFDEGFNPQMLLSIPVAPGHSGSGVFRNGEVFGIVSRRYNAFEHASLAVSLEMVKKAYGESIKVWNAS